MKALDSFSLTVMPCYIYSDRGTSFMSKELRDYFVRCFYEKGVQFFYVNSISFDIFKYSGTYTTQEGWVFVWYFAMEIYKIQ